MSVWLSLFVPAYATPYDWLSLGVMFFIALLVGLRVRHRARLVRAALIASIAGVVLGTTSAHLAASNFDAVSILAHILRVPFGTLLFVFIAAWLVVAITHAVRRRWQARRIFTRQ